MSEIDVFERADEVLSLFRRGAEFTKELLDQNRGLRERLLQLESRQQDAAQDNGEWAKLRGELVESLLAPGEKRQPGSGGGQALSGRRLSDLAAGDHTVVERVYEEDEELLRFFDEEGIRPGLKLDVLDVAPYRGTVTVQLNGRELVLGLEAARRIWIREG